MQRYCLILPRTVICQLWDQGVITRADVLEPFLCRNLFSDGFSPEANLQGGIRLDPVRFKPKADVDGPEKRVKTMIEVILSFQNARNKNLYL